MILLVECMGLDKDLIYPSPTLVFVGRVSGIGEVLNISVVLIYPSPTLDLVA